MIIDIVPPEGVGPVRIGMTMDEAQLALAAIDGYRPPSGSIEPSATYDSGMSIELESALDGTVGAIQVYRPHSPVRIEYRGIDLLRTPAARVVEQLAEITELEEDEGGRSFVAPSLLLSLWRPFVEDQNADEEQGHFFQSVLVAQPGYYDGPMG
ncbi:hypothetical protein LQ757_00585 [Agromyces sp. SYSU K20354]|uniref:hypothetical protein n=1 Tax=Agromyces cavernae TaxID=2898659 RepID=UPI001E2BB005|nr:hypothetical protein [Agromyces cavernae]MCD2440764.1 hypothetical protein [Agromyces cavernae]